MKMESSLMHLFLLSLAFSCCFTFADLINDICSETSNPSLCSNALRSDPRSPGADSKLLGQISIDVALKSAKSGLALVTKLGKGVTDPRLKGIYDTCLETYGDSVDSLQECSAKLKSGDYSGLNSEASSAGSYISTCDDSFDELGKAEPPELLAASKNGQDLCTIISVISNGL